MFRVLGLEFRIRGVIGDSFLGVDGGFLGLRAPEPFS